MNNAINYMKIPDTLSTHDSIGGKMLCVNPGINQF